MGTDMLGFACLCGLPEARGAGARVALTMVKVKSKMSD